MSSIDTLALVTATVSMSGETVCKFGDSGTVMMWLHDGPLDGEQQIVQGTVDEIGRQCVFNIPNYQTFDADGMTLTSLGLQVTYVVTGQAGLIPNVGAGDTWDSSWNLEYVPGSYIPPIPPPALGPPPDMPLSPAVWMGVVSSMVVTADNPSPGVQMVDTASALLIAGTTITAQWATVGMSATSGLTAVGTGTYGFGMTANSGLTANATTQIGVGMGATTSMVINKPVFNQMTPGGGVAGDAFTIQGTNLAGVVSLTWTRALGGATATQTVFTAQTDTSIQGMVPATLTLAGNYLITGQTSSGGVVAPILYTVMVNLLDPQASSLEDGTTTGWTNGYINVSISNTTAQAAVGSHSLMMTAVTNGDIATVLTPPYRVSVAAGPYDIAGQFRAATTGRLCTMFYNWYNASGTNLGSGNVPLVTSNNTGWTTVGTTVVAPATAVAMDIAPYIEGCTAGEVHYVDHFTIH
jgi:hypothetical protein